MSDEESTQEIDIAALRDSLAAARGSRPSVPDSSSSDRETARRAQPTDEPVTLDAVEAAENADRAVASAPFTRRSAGPTSEREGDEEDPISITSIDVAPAAPNPMQLIPTPIQSIEPFTLDALEALDSSPESVINVDDLDPPAEDDSVVDLADVEDVEDDEQGDVYGATEAEAHDARYAHEETNSLIGTVPGHDVAQALRAMMGEVPDEPLSRPPPWGSQTLEDGETQTRLPSADADAADPVDDDAGPSTTGEDEALPAFALDDPLDESQGASWPRAEWSLDRSPAPATARAFAGDIDLANLTRALPYPSSEAADPEADRASTGITRAVRREVAETTAVFLGPVPSMARPSTRDPSTEEIHAVEPPPPLPENTPRFLQKTASFSDETPRFLLSDDPTRFPEADTLDHGASPPTVASFPNPDELPEGELPRFTLASIPEMPPEVAAMPEPAPAPPELLEQLGPLELEIIDEPFTITPDLHAPDSLPHTTSSPSLHSVDVRISSPSIDTSAFDGEILDDPTAVGVTVAPAIDTGDLPPTSVASSVPIVISEPAPAGADEEEAEILEIASEEMIEDAQSTSVGVARPPQAAFRPPAPITTSQKPPNALDALDPEEKELLEERRFGPLIAVYRQRLSETEGPNKKAALLLKIASVYETGLEDGNEAFQTLVEAFEIAPDNADVVAAVDRVGRQTQRIGELADKVKKKLLPGSPDDKRVVYLGHLVYWYERVLGRGGEVSSFVSEIERQDKVHPVVLKRAAQLAAMNGDTKTQREHLGRALKRTSRREEKVALYLALASAYAGTPDALKNYEAALEIEPTSLVALQGVKRLGKEKEQYAQVQWALERQAEVAPTEAERIDALLELAELQETKFLKRELAAELLERVLEIEPAHPAAMKGLERCYHALRDWPKLARILGVRSEHSFDKNSKVELLELAAEVHESKLGDAAAAVEVYRNLLIVEPKHRRALGDLARLYEKLGDWANVASYKARLAELAPTKRASSQELVKLGDFLNTPERDSIAAKLQYERAVTVDPTNAAGWEALQKLAAEAGDDRRVIECLEQRKKHTDVPRQRAVVLVELANVHRAAGDEDAAQKCFEAAVRADSSNEPAAVVMLDTYTAEERWAEAAPLCELLVNAAIRDRDGESLFVRLRLATRIAAALGDADRAMTSAIAALDARPKDSGAQADLIAVASQCRGSSTSLEKARQHLAQLADNADELPGDHLVRLGGLQRDFGDLDVAARMFERARHLEPEDQDITKELADVYLAQGDFPRACKLKVDMARNAMNAEARFDLFCEAGEIWARRADELEKAASVFEEARAIKPHDPWLLQTMMWLYGELGEWGLLTGVLEDMAQVQENPDEKQKSLIAMAEVVRDKLDDRIRASDLLDQVLDIDKKRLDVFEELVRMLTEEKNWERLERSYRKMIARVKDDDEPQLQFLLFHQLGLIYRDRLGDASRAYDALDAASRLQPTHAEVRKIVVELLVVTDNLDNAVARLRDEIDRDPHEPQLYAELYELFLRQLFFDKAWCTVNVLSRLREPTPEQRRFHEDYAPMPLDRVPGQIVEQAWRTHIFHAELDPALTNLFALLTPAVARMRFGQLRPEQGVGRPFTPAHSRMYETIRTTFDNSAEILAVASPELLLGDLTSVAAFAPALAPYGAILVCGQAVEAQSSSLIYLVGKHLAEQRPELTAHAFFPSVPDLSSLLAAAVRVSRNEVAKDTAGAALDASFMATLSPLERDAIRSVVLQATSESASFDVKRWSQAADLSSMRAGLLIAGDVEPARDAILAEGPSPSDLTPTEKVGELYKFATSDLYSDLRGAIGVAVQA